MQLTYWRNVKMIKAEVVFDGDRIICNGVSISYQCGDGGSVYYFADGDFSENETLEEAVKYCMGNSNE